MKNKIILFFLLMFSTVGLAHASSSFPNNYTFYESAAWDTVSGNLLITVQVTGTTLPPVPPMSGAFHYAKIYAGDPATGSWKQGPNYCTTCNMNWTTPAWSLDVGSDCVDFLIVCDATVDETVVCTVAGTFVNVTAPYDIERAISMAANTGTSPTNGGWYLNTRCTAATSPPDFQFNILFNWPVKNPNTPIQYFPFYKSRNICFRTKGMQPGSAWTCAPAIRYPNPISGTGWLGLSQEQAYSEFATYGDSQNYNCTNRDKGYDGLPFP